MFTALDTRPAEYFYTSPSHVAERVFAQRSPSLSSSDTPPSPVDDMDSYQQRAREYQLERRPSDAGLVISPSATYNPSFSHQHFGPTPTAPSWTKHEQYEDPTPSLLDYHHHASRHSSLSHSTASSPGIPMLPHHHLDSSPSPGPHTPPPSSGNVAGGSAKTFNFISLQGQAQRKRPRRRYDEIERLYQCSWPGCAKAYGTLNHLNAHVTMQRHGDKRLPAEFKEMRKQWRRDKKDQAALAASSLASPRAVSLGGGSRRSLRGIGGDDGSCHPGPLASPVALDFGSDPAAHGMYYPQQEYQHQPPRRMSLPNLQVPNMHVDRFPHAGNDLLQQQQSAGLQVQQDYWPPAGTPMYALAPAQAPPPPMPVSAPPHQTTFNAPAFVLDHHHHQHLDQSPPRLAHHAMLMQPWPPASPVGSEHD